MTQTSPIPVLPATVNDQVAEAIELLDAFFKDEVKTNAWFNIENPLLGNCTPMELFIRDRGHKVLSFIKNAIDENTCAFTDKILKGEKV